MNSFKLETLYQFKKLNMESNCKETTITLHGTMNYHLVIDGLGTVYTDAKTYEMKVNLDTGEPISIMEVDH